MELLQLGVLRVLVPHGTFVVNIVVVDTAGRCCCTTVTTETPRRRKARPISRHAFDAQEFEVRQRGKCCVEGVAEPERPAAIQCERFEGVQPRQQSKDAWSVEFPHRAVPGPERRPGDPSSSSSSSFVACCFCCCSPVESVAPEAGFSPEIEAPVRRKPLEVYQRGVDQNRCQGHEVFFVGAIVLRKGAIGYVPTNHNSSGLLLFPVLFCCYTCTRIRSSRRRCCCVFLRHRSVALRCAASLNVVLRLFVSYQRTTYFFAINLVFFWSSFCVDDVYGSAQWDWWGWCSPWQTTNNKQQQLKKTRRDNPNKPVVP
mmetsp:Transcript_5360/g.12232  ORF Transcript_5360/g.12232 Transcript_5360/m.12232 type:complete len:314 (+) Transcript_5360:765-1706(+)